MSHNHYSVLIIGAGPAGLTAGYLLAKQQHSSIIIEADNLVGGISRTPHYKNFYFDIGGHRFFSKSEMIEKLWDEMLPNQLLTRPRKSRIFYRKKFYDYPLKPINALQQLGWLESMRCVFSYAHAKLKPKTAHSFSDWITNQFGQRLYQHFFKTYTEKVWGMSCDDISANWAAQRIQGLTLGNAIKNAFLPKKIIQRKKAMIKTLTDSFRYPPRGPGMLWESCAQYYQDQGGTLLLKTHVIACEYHQTHWQVVVSDKQNQQRIIQCEHIISSAPIKNLVCDYLLPTPHADCVHAASQLRYRDFLIVVLIVKERHPLDDNWIYIHDPAVKVARIQNFKSWSSQMVPDPTLCSYGLEYFCNTSDPFWNLSDEQLIQLATTELLQIGLAHAEDIMDGCVVRQPKAYPVYDHAYQQHLDIIHPHLQKHYPNLHLVGRNGLHKYNNQDHSMMTAIMTVQNILANQSIHDVWRVNQDDEYHETQTASEFDNQLGLRDTPRHKN